MGIPVLADADALFGGATRGLLIHLDYRGLIHLHWSPLILDELSRALVATGRKPDAAAARAHEALMRASLPTAEIPTAEVQSRFEAVASGVRSAKDTHVAAAALVVLARGFYPGQQAVSLLTRNVKDFSVRNLAALGIDVVRPDPFLLSLFSRQTDAMASAFRAFRSSLRSGPSVQMLLDKLAADGQTRTAAALGDAKRNGRVAL